VQVADKIAIAMAVDRAARRIMIVAMDRGAAQTTWIVLGAGYTGLRLADRLVTDGHAVIVTRRTAEALPAGHAGRVADLADRASLETLPAGDAIVVCLAPPGDDPGGEIRTLVRATRAARRLVYVSSTGVYGPAAGAWVDESAPLAPITASGRARVAAEEALAASAVSTVVLRVAGIHGPGRGIAERLRAGTYRIIGDGSSHVSRIHVDDLVEAIVRAGSATIAGAINIADDAPDPIGAVADALADELGVPHPPRVAPDTVSPEIAGMLTADRRIANTRMVREFGVVLRHPSWRA
jgi:nucleoside-diphosphate-sugar epimerase